MNDSMTHFKHILKKKGTGKTMSKHMDQQDIDFVIHRFNDNAIPLAMKATLLTAWMMLKNTPEEAEGLHSIRKHADTMIPKELHYLLSPSNHYIDLVIQQAMNGEEISTHNIQQIFHDIDQQLIPEYKIASFLEALRLKEETLNENSLIYDAFKDRCIHHSLDLPLLIDFATPYDGFNRSYFLQPFLCALLASVGVPSVIHGIYEVSPKQGMNTHKLLLSAKKNPLQELTMVKQQIENPTIGWGYIDQSHFCPSLYRLVQTRIDMVKRPVLATIEKWLQPFSAKQTICVTGFTHPPYKQKTLDIIRHANCYDQLILVRGVEGSTLLPLDRRAPFITMMKSSEPDFSFISPEDHGFEQTIIQDQDPNQSLTAGLSALNGNQAVIQDYLCYQALAITTAVGLNITLDALVHAIESGRALLHWENGCC